MRILCNILVLLFVTTAAVGQQINPVPDYIFRNQMSVGRNAATDTAAYMSIGPRFGATKGFMPPMVVDTNAVTGTKRNGLLIFSVQLNNFAYWDSTTSRFRKITAEAIVDSLLYSTRAWRQKGDDSLGALIGLRVRFTDTASMLTPYLRKVDTTAMLTPYLRKVDTTAMLTPYVRTAGYGLTKGTQTLSADTGLMATRLRVQKGIDSLAATEIDGSGTVNYVPKFTATRTLGNSKIFDNGTNVGIGTTSPGSPLHVQRADDGIIEIFRGTSNAQLLVGVSSGNIYYDASNGNANHTFQTNGNERMRLTSAGRLLVGTTTEGTNTVDIAGTLRSTQGANFATTSGLVGIGTTSPTEVLHVVGRGRFTTIDSTSSPINLLTSDVNGVIRKTSIAASGGLTGTGISGYVPKFTSSSAVDTSSIFISSGRVALGSTNVSNGGLSVYNGNIFTNRKFVRGTPQDTARIFAMVGSGNEGSIIIEEYNTSTNGPEIFQRKGRGTPDSKSNVQVGDAIGGYDFGGYVDGSLNTSALVTASVTEVDTLNDIAYSNLLIRQSYNNTTQTNATFKSSNGGLEIRGDVKVGSIDSTASAINMLYADANGVIKKARGPISIQTDDPTGGTSKPWKLGAVATVSPTSPNRTIMVEIDGTVYYIHAKTTND